jgi:D-glycero-D-manno-heptose 1,7-bisphosphate phosphatase
MVPGLFLDRDGVIIENRSSYIRSWDDVVFYPDALAALAQVKTTKHKIILVTNQSAIGRGIISSAQAWEINERVVETIKNAGGRVDGVYMCPHSPDEGCECRKPQPGLLIQAARELSVDLNQSILIGDALSDIQAGQAAGIKQTILVRTGRGADQLNQPFPPELKPFSVQPDLYQALQASHWLAG